MSSLNIYLCLVKSRNCDKIDVHPFFRKLYELFSTREFMIFDDSGKGNGPYVFYPKYEWKEYKKGYNLGVKMRNKKYKKHINKIKKNLEICQVKNIKIFIKNF